MQLHVKLLLPQGFMKTLQQSWGKALKFGSYWFSKHSEEGGSPRARLFGETFVKE